MSFSRNLTKEFDRLRTEQKMIISQAMHKKLDYLERNEKKVANPEGVGSFLAAFTGSGHCRACGSVFHVLQRGVSCAVCKSQFCINCCRPIEEESIAETLDAVLGAAYSCEKCTLILNFQQSKEYRRSFRSAIINSKVNQEYAIVSNLRHQFLKLCPQLEYLTDSLLEFEHTGSERDDEAFGNVYRQAKVKERKLLSLLKGYQESMKPFVLKAKENRFMGRINVGYTDFLKLYIPKIKEFEQNIAQLELDAVSDVYVFLHLLHWETKSHAAFSQSYKSTFREALAIMKKELVEVCVAKMDGLQWDTQKSKLENLIKQGRLFAIENPDQALIATRRVQGASRKDLVAAMLEPQIIRKASAVIEARHKTWMLRGVHAPGTAKVMALLVEKLVKNYEGGSSWM